LLFGDIDVGIIVIVDDCVDDVIIECYCVVGIVDDVIVIVIVVVIVVLLMMIIVVIDICCEGFP